MSNWEDRLAGVVDEPAPAASPNWEDRLKSVAMSIPLPAQNPTAGGSTLQIFNPFGANIDTGFPIGEASNNFLSGIGKAFYDIGRGAAQKVGAYSFADAAKDKALDKPLMDTTAGKVGNIAGNVAAALPAAFVPGAGTLAGAAGMGSALGFMQPATGWGDMTLNTGAGAVGGAAGNLVGRAVAGAYGLGKSLVSPFFAKGQQSLADKVLAQFVPDAQQAAAKIAADAGEIVPGSLPTAAEAAQVPGLSNLTKQVQQTPGLAAADALAQRAADNNAARVAAVRAIAGDESQRASLEAARSTTANQLYSAARAQGVDPAAFTPEAQANIAAFQQRLEQAVPGIVSDAKKIAAGFGQPMDDTTSVNGMHWIKEALDNRISKAVTAGAKTKAASLMSLKNDLMQGLEAMSPTYANANATFAQMSAPINKMDVGQAVADRLIPALNNFGDTANLNASGFAQALQHGDATAQRALGFPGAKMADVMGPQDMATLNALGQDLARSASAARLAKAAGSDTVKNALSQNLINSTLGPFGIPPSAGTNTLLQSFLRPWQYAAGLAEPKVLNKLGMTLLDPAATRAALLRAPGLIGPSFADTALGRYAYPALGAPAAGLLSNLAQ